MTNTYRLHGSLVNRDTPYIDVTITDVKTDGTVTLEETNGIDKWEKPIEWLETHEKDGLVVEGAPNSSALWDILDAFDKANVNTDTTRASKELFRAAVNDSQ